MLALHVLCQSLGVVHITRRSGHVGCCSGCVFNLSRSTSAQDQVIRAKHYLISVLLEAPSRFLSIVLRRTRVCRIVTALREHGLERLLGVSWGCSDDSLQVHNY